MGYVEVIEKVSDEIAALLVICVGLAFLWAKDFQNGYLLVGSGTSYLFGKSVPKKNRNDNE